MYGGGGPVCTHPSHSFLCPFLPLFCTPGCQELGQTVGQGWKQDRRGICPAQGYGLFGKPLLNTHKVESCSLTFVLKLSTR